MGAVLPGIRAGVRSEYLVDDLPGRMGLEGASLHCDVRSFRLFLMRYPRVPPDEGHELFT